MNLDKEFIPYQEALELKELGFDEPCFGNWQDMKEANPWLSNSYTISQDQYYGQLCSAPTYSQAFRWFREKYKLYHDIKMFGDWDKPQYSYYVSGRTMNNQAHMWHYEDVNSYPEAELACLRKLIELVKNR